MNSKLKVLALSAAVLAGMAAAPAQAFVYADSRLLINNLRVNASGPFAVTNFTFTTTNTAVLNNSPVITTGTCAGSFNGGGVLVTNSCGAAPVLNAGPASAGAPPRPANNFAYTSPLGASGFEFSNSASSIDTSELLGPTATSTRQIAESELQAGTSASASALIQSITGFTFTFTLAAPGSLALSFSADPDQYAAISELLNGAYSAQSSMSTSFTLQQLGGANQFVTWAPRGSAANDCIAVNGASCTETNDQANLNATIGTVTPGSVDLNQTTGLAGFGLFGINVGGLLAGTYSLTLAANTATQLNRLVIPEPGTVALLGVGLAALALRGKRKAKQQA